MNEPGDAGEVGDAVTLTVLCAMDEEWSVVSVGVRTLLILARAELESVHCVSAVTSWVVSSARCATAFSTAAPATLNVEGGRGHGNEARVPRGCRSLRLKSEKRTGPTNKREPLFVSTRPVGALGVFFNCDCLLSARGMVAAITPTGPLQRFGGPLVDCRLQDC
jgi:hypothetical protein